MPDALDLSPADTLAVIEELPADPHTVLIAARARGGAGVALRLGLGGELAPGEEPVRDHREKRICRDCGARASRYTAPDPLTAEPLCFRCWQTWEPPAGWYWCGADEQPVEDDGPAATAARITYYELLEDDGRCPPELTRASRAAAELALQEAAAARHARAIAARANRALVAAMTPQELVAHKAEVRRRGQERHKQRYKTDPAYAERVRERHRAHEARRRDAARRRAG